MEKEYCVYTHTFPNGKAYIGQTKQKPEYRFKNGEGYKGCTYVYAAIQKYGWDNVKHEVFASGLSKEGADFWEDALIKLYRSNEREYGYNLRTGGTCGYEYTEEAKTKMSYAQLGRKASEETKKKHSEALKKYYSTHSVSEETREKLRKAGKGKRRASRGYTPQMMKNIAPHQFKKGHKPNEKSMNTLREKTSKRVAQYDLEGNIVAIHPSIVEASRYIGMSRNAVGNCVRGRTKTAGGYIWRYADGQ